MPTIDHDFRSGKWPPGMNRRPPFGDLPDTAPEPLEPSDTAVPVPVLAATSAGAGDPAAAAAFTAPPDVATLSEPAKPATPDARLPAEPVPFLGVERDHMAWPPAGWEAVDPSWRTDLNYPPEPSPGAGSALLGDAAAGAAVGTAVWPELGTAEHAHAGAHPKRWMREVIETVVLALVIFLGIRVFVLQFKIEGTSMAPTMADGEYILVNRLAYRLFGEPRRGDIIVFESWTPGKDYIKRVIGLPGQRIEVRGMEVFIDGERIDEAYLPSTTTSGDTSVILGPDEYFVMGDNRDNSQDSRALGALQGEKIIGKAWLIYWPVRSMGLVPDADQDRPVITDPLQG